MFSHRCQQLLILDIPNVLICPAGEIGDQLTETPLRIALPQFADYLKKFSIRLLVHGSFSLTLGIRVISA
jgi:hypothetical protein